MTTTLWASQGQSVAVLYISHFNYCTVVAFFHTSTLHIAVHVCLGSPQLRTVPREMFGRDLQPVLRRNRASRTLLLLLSRHRCQCRGRGPFLMDAGCHLVLPHPVKLDWLVVRPAGRAGRRWGQLTEKSRAPVVWKRNENTSHH